MASFGRRKTGWQVRVTGYHPVTGQRLERTRAIRGTKYDALRVAREMERLKHNGELTRQQSQLAAWQQSGNILPPGEMRSGNK